MTKPHRIYSDRIQIVPPEDTDGVARLSVPNELEVQATNTQFLGSVDLGPRTRFVEIDDYQGNRMMFVDPTQPQVLDFDGDITVDFNNCTVQNLAGSSVGQLEASQINSSNSGYTTVDNELDDLQLRTTLNTQRTTGLTANKMMSTSGAGIIQASTIDTNSVANKSASVPQAFTHIVSSPLGLLTGADTPGGGGDGLYRTVFMDGTNAKIHLTHFTRSSGTDTPSTTSITFNQLVHGLTLQDTATGDLDITADAGGGSLNLSTSGAQYQIGGTQIGLSNLSDGANVVIDDFTGVQTLDCSVLQLNGADGLRFGSSPQYHIKSDYSNNRLLYSSNFDHVFQAGTNGATTACQIADDGMNIIDLSDTNIGYTAPASLTRVATRAYVGALLQSSTTQAAIINTVEFTNTVFREFDATPTALTLTINRPTTITKNVNMTSGDMTISNALSCNDLTVVNNVLDDLTFAADKTIDFANTASFTAGHVLALDTNKKLTARALADSDGVVLKTGTQVIAGTKSFSAGCNALAGWSIFGGNLNLDNTNQITTHTTFGNSYVAGTDQEYCASRGCMFLTTAQSVSGTKTHTDLQIASNGTLKLLDSVNIADGSILGVNAGRFVVSRSLSDSDGVVMKTGAQTIVGTKTFSDSVIVGDVNTNFSFFSTAGILSLNSTAPAVQFNNTGQNIQIINDATNRLSIESASVKIDATRDIQRTKNSTAVTDYLDRIDRLYTDYRRNIVSTELFGADWITPTLYKEYQSNGTEYTGTGSVPVYAEITVLKWARSIASSDPSDSSKYTQFTHNVNQNTAWDLDYSSVADGLLKSGVFTCQITFNGNNRAASTTRFSDYAFIGNTWVSNASCRVDIHNNIHGVNDATPGYTPLSTSCSYHANASTSSNEFANAEQPVFLLKNVAASPFELVFRFPISSSGYSPSYGYFTSSSNAGAFLQKKNVNVQVKFKQVDDWNHFPVDFTANDYTS